VRGKADQPTNVPLTESRNVFVGFRVRVVPRRHYAVLPDVSFGTSFEQ
jgi:hypothetical protein